MWKQTADSAFICAIAGPSDNMAEPAVLRSWTLVLKVWIYFNKKSF